jgi:DNA repair exonuclease SbcCD ATPase subunit
VDTPADSPRPSLSLSNEDRKGAASPVVEASQEPVNGSTAADANGKESHNDAEPVAELQPSTSKEQTGASVEGSRRSSNSLANLQETVSNLLAERTDLQAEITRLKAVETSAKSDASLLDEGRTLIARLEEEKKALEDKVDAADVAAKKTAETEAALEKVRGELETAKRETDVALAAQEALEDKLEEHKGKEGERVAELEKVLEREREREGSLEAEIGRLKQVSRSYPIKADVRTTQRHRRACCPQRRSSTRSRSRRPRPILPSRNCRPHTTRSRATTARCRTITAS